MLAKVLVLVLAPGRDPVLNTQYYPTFLQILPIRISPLVNFRIKMLP